MCKILHGARNIKLLSFCRKKLHVLRVGRKEDKRISYTAYLLDV